MIFQPQGYKIAHINGQTGSYSGAGAPSTRGEDEEEGGAVD